jgi:hypothetical protein
MFPASDLASFHVKQQPDHRMFYCAWGCFRRKHLARDWPAVSRETLASPSFCFRLFLL